jgi:hypothetical protein
MIKILIIMLMFVGNVYADTATLNPTSDTHIRGGASADTNRDETGLNAKDTSDADFDRSSVLMFSLSSIPAGSVIDSVTFKGISSGSGSNAGVVNIFEGLRAWVETEATWNIYSTGNSWGSAGARGDDSDIVGDWVSDSGSEKLASFAVPGDQSAGDTFTFTSTAAFITYITNNIGGTINICIQQEQNDDANFTFYDSENATESNRPLLTIVYTPPGGKSISGATLGGSTI